MIVVPNGVDTEQFFPMDRQAVRKQLALAPEARYLVTVAHLRRTKGFLDVLDALPAIRKKCGDVRWLIVGGSTRMYHFEPELRREIRRRELDDVVRLVGPQPPQQVNVYLNAADLFVLATHGEGWCNVLMESLATGLPVVTTAVGGNPEIVRDENLGLLVPPRDSEALASAVVAALVRTWNRKGLVDYAKELTWDATARKVITFFELRAEKGGTGWL